MTASASPATPASPQAAPPPQKSGPWAPFSQRAFLVLWGATVISNIGTWMHDVGAGWLMTELSPSPLVVALVQAATTAPIFLFALLAGAIADIVDRRKLLILVNLFMGVIATLLAVAVALELVTPGLLVAMTFLLGTGAAFQAPAWQAIVPSLVGKPMLPAAIALNSMGINVSRAIGPALAGFLIIALGLASPFAANALSFVAIILALLWWRPAPTTAKTLPAESVSHAVISGLRYALHSRPIQNSLMRAAGFFAFASAYWAMLPLIAREMLQGGATLYGLLLASVGAGAVGGALILPKIRARLGADKTVALGTIGTALALLTFALSPPTWAAVLVSALAGASWIAVLSSLHVSVQTALPEWVRARGLSIFLTVFFGAMSLGSLVWGKVADSWSLETALVASAIGAVLLIPVTWRAKLQRAEGLDLTPSMHWPEPVLDPSLSEQQDHGPVMIQIVYQVPMDQETAFLALMETLRHARQRQGAFNWSLMRNAEDPTRFTELWFEASWQQHLRHHARVTGDDRAIQKQLRDHLAPGTDPLITHHMTAEHHPEAPSGQPPDPGAETPVATDQGERP